MANVESNKKEESSKKPDDLQLVKYEEKENVEAPTLAIKDGSILETMKIESNNQLMVPETKSMPILKGFDIL